MSFEVDARELTAVASDLRAATGRVGAQASGALRRTAFAIEAEAKMFCPVDTGNLRNSISTSIAGDGRTGSVSAEIGPTADYGVFVELGTSRMAGQAFMGSAFDRQVPVFESAVSGLGADVFD